MMTYQGSFFVYVPSQWEMTLQCNVISHRLDSFTKWFLHIGHYEFRADSRPAPSQWETLLQCNAVSHWLGANLESALCVNTLRPSEVHVWNWSGSLFVQVMDWSLSDSKPLLVPEPMLTYHRFDPKNIQKWNLNQNIKLFIQELKCLWKWHFD